MVAFSQPWQYLGTMRTRIVVFIFLFATGVLVGKGCSDSTMRCIESEKQALLSFKQSFVVKDGDYPLSSWTSNTDCCSWGGISCDNKTNHVIQLVVRRRQLRSEINPSLVQLKYLEHLELPGNNLSKIPEFIGSLTRLTYLDLSGNPISGTIPYQLGNLTSLSSLSLSGTRDNYGTVTVSNFGWISRLSSLKYLELVNFTTTSDWFQSIQRTPSLTELFLSGCQLPEVDTSSLSHINPSNSFKSISMVFNTIHPTVIPWLLNLSSDLVDLTLNQNHIGGPLPNSFGNMPSLEYIDMHDNEFEGEIPKSLGTLSNLKSLDLSFNKLRGTLDNLLGSQVSCTTQNQLGGSVFPALEELYLDVNLLEGPLPSSLRQLPKLLVLSLGYNLLRGPLPNLSPFSSLERLVASHNKLDGSLPESIGQLRNLTTFHVSSNSFSGVISEPHLMNLSKLLYLDLSFNSLRFNLSSNWVPPFQILYLSLASCTMGTRFPNWLRTQSQLSTLDLSNSSIFGDIPSWFSNVSSNLEHLDISFNHLSGMVPNFCVWGSPVVDMSHNQFRGAIPPSLSNASELYLSNDKFTEFRRLICTPNNILRVAVLDLSDNLLSGTMPDCWLQWRRLGILNLENNNLSGIIPSSLGSLDLQTLLLRNNSLSGNLPSSLSRSSQLLVLDVGHNSLNGKIPTWIGETLGLKLLSLKSNEFYGSIPSNLCHLDSIQILDLSLNNLSGVIPSCINNFTSMAHNKGDAYATIDTLYFGSRIPRRYQNGALLMWKGLEYKYDKILGLLRLIDLSSNRLTGQIPATLAKLVELVQVNLSKNHFSGIIPTNIGELNRLESLDLSHNQLSGKIPMGLAKLSSLAYLDLSNNHLWGRIPTSTQLQSFDGSRYAGNIGLCGPPLTSTCPEDKTLLVPSNSSGGNEREWLDMSWFNSGIGVGFVVGFWGLCGTLTFKTAWRHAYFGLLNKLGDWLYMTIIVQKARLRRRLKS
ncbi:hypothetical protein FNV43_RR23073 [Rhamnella rubrinervis]|uniref:Leucine-rich repeat-containing N-terminal plant-type domain-containing protein n=1 Tax=Rhamnella rubrinervis TaxID=2594499 RepID=A0A8K0DSN8_9ROSA|nr:hypothetical protein FNV43_RR23073 [Rhamnella rubrinervis]